MDFSKYGKIEMDYIEASRELERLEVVRNNCKSNIHEIIAAVQSLASLVDYQCNINEYEVVNKGLDDNVDQIASRLRSQINGYKSVAISIGSDISELNNVVQEVTSNNTKEYQKYMKKSKFKVTDVVYYNQYDYGNASYGDDTISNSGCGPTSAAMILSTFLDEEVTPQMACDFSAVNGHLVVGGTEDAFFDDIFNEYGVSYTKEEQTEENIISSLEDGNLIIAHVGPSEFTKSGHFIVLSGLDENGNVIVADPASRRRTEVTWSSSYIANIRRGQGMYIVSP